VIEIPVVGVVRGSVTQVTIQAAQQPKMLIEFGQFSATGDAMVELRGRGEDEADWHQYNRPFKRC